ncbi:MAG: hypothetical protein GF330_03145 [Candidatus Eisenbacteria bacterium]|nr:hypothetical protein [Candidatus Eisenbacteria bacterium]
MTSRIRNWAAPTLAAVALAILFPAGSSAAEVVWIEEDTGPAGMTLVAQAPSGVQVHFGMDRFAFESVTVNGQEMQAVTLPGVFLPNDAGAPDLAGMGRYIALPEGASATFEILHAQTQRFSGVDVAPAPVIPRENDDSPLTYAADLTIYNEDAFYPDAPVKLSEVQQMRGVDCTILGITPFQYNPVTRELLVYTELEVRIDFHGGSGTFAEERLRSRFWEPILETHLLNYDALPAVDFNRPPRHDRQGCEYLIICPDNAPFIAWADSLRAWRTAQGITTEVWTTTEIGGTSSTAIEDFINDAYANWDPAPSAFLMLGDYPGSGDFRDEGLTSPTWSGYCVSDNIYADIDGDDLPEIAHARICARDEADLETMIGKMFSYEREPVTDPYYYDHPVIAGGWQTERWFILCCEVCLGYCQTVLGQDPVREYAIYSGSPGSSWSSNQNTYMVVDYFGPNGLGYIPATPEHLTDWGGNATRLNNDLNAGAYMLMHRDHGSVTGWGEPDYGNSDLDGLYNDKYPFVFSINCLTGQYDWSGECFTEKFHRISAGAVGLVAASEVSYSFVNDTFVWGMFDGLWPDFDPGYGQPEPIWEAPARTAFAQASGKLYLQASNWPYNPSNKDETYHLFHHHGDAFISMYSQLPQELNVIHEEVLFTDVDVFTVQADEGSLIALSVDGELIGVADGTGYPVDIPITPQPEPGSLQVVVTKANHFRYEQTVSIIPPAGPYMVIGDRIIDDDLEDESLGNADGGADAGETIELVLGLRNVGTETATNVRATLVCEDPCIEITDDYEEYGDVLPDEQVFCLEDYDFVVTPDCPDGHIFSFTLNVQSDDRMLWEKHFTIEVEAPILGLLSYQIDDTTGGDGDGRIEPGETVQMIPLIGNDGSEDATNLSVYLHVYSPYVEILEGTTTLPAVPAGGQGSPMGAFEFSVDAACPDPDILDGSLVINADWQQGATPEFTLPVGGFFDDMEAGPGLWTHYIVTGGFVDQWHQSTQRNYTPGGTTSWKFGDTGAGDYANQSDGALETESLPLRDECYLRFRHWMEAEVSGMHADYCYDGGMVEMSIDGGAWEQITPVGGYPYLIRDGSIPGPWPAETPVFSGQIDWAEAVFEVFGYSGEAKFRFRFGTDGADTREGWYVDEVEWSGTSQDPQDAGDWTPVALRPIVQQNQPNPFRPQTVIGYRLPESGRASLRIFDASGRAVRTLVDGEHTAGMHYAIWDGRGDDGAVVGSGVYFYRFEADGIHETRKMVRTQ